MKNLFICLVVLGLTACGTIFSGMSQDFSFDSEDKDVKVYLNGRKECSKLPCEFSVDRSFDDVTFKAIKKGYKPKKIIAKSRFNLVSLVNIFFPIGFVVDLATGSMWGYKIRDYEVDFEPEDKD